MERITRFTLRTLVAGLALIATAAHADMKVGIVVSATGPAASLGIPQKNTVPLLPKEIAGQKIDYIVLDDASDTTTAVKNVKKLIDEEHVDLVIGPSTTPNAIAMMDAAAESETPTISLAAAQALISPMDAKKKWVFKTPQNDSLMAAAVVDHMVSRKVQTIALFALTDSYGQNWVNEMTRIAGEKGIKVVASESYQPTDPSVTGQTLRVIAAKPDAVLIASRGTPAVLPAKALKERGYTGPIYQTHGVANNDFLRLGGKDVEGSIVPVGPVLVATQLPDSSPVKKTALEYIKVYDAMYGPGSYATFGAHLWDAGLLLKAAMPEALKKGQPGTKAFRTGLRDALENVKNLTITQGVMSMTPTDHSGLDQRARVMVEVVDNKWKLAQ
jgi:branched-chain amino acid transport system substrate-binding protein